MRKQVEKSHYQFHKYMSKKRWMSVWHQIDEVSRFKPSRVLEIGPGPGVFKSAARSFGLQVETLDIDPELKPDHVAPAEAMPFEDNEFDVACAFQMLEHVPYDLSLKIFKEMCRVARYGVVISLPDAEAVWPFSLYIPFRGGIQFHVVRPFRNKMIHTFDGEHYWEINKVGYELKKVLSDFYGSDDKVLIKHFKVFDNPYHHFMVYSAREIGV